MRFDELWRFLGSAPAALLVVWGTAGTLAAQDVAGHDTHMSQPGETNWLWWVILVAVIAAVAIWAWRRGRPPAV